jgi:hypothetical protein
MDNLLKWDKARDRDDGAMSMMIPIIIENALPLIIPTHDVVEGA